MREYVVFKIKCKKDLKCEAVYEKIKTNLKFNNSLFALQNLDFNRLGPESQRIYEEISLNKYSYKKVLPHLKNSSYYNPERDDRQMISNLDERWEWSNTHNTQQLNKHDLEELITFYDKLKTSATATRIIGFDEIEWNGKKVRQGTYGFKKADCTYNLGQNYLSNSLIIGKTYSDKVYTAYLSCEKIFVGVDIIQELIDFLGEKVLEISYFAPECDRERDEWEQTATNAKNRFDKAISDLGNLPLKVIAPQSTTIESSKINIRKYIKNYLCTDGWEIRSALHDEWPTIVYRTKGDNDICLSIISGHNGHHLQSIVYYRSKKFVLADHILALSFNEISEDDLEKYFYNATLIRDYLYNAL